MFATDTFAKDALARQALADENWTAERQHKTNVEQVLLGVTK